MRRSLLLALLLASPLRADSPKAKPYFPPPESKGGWRTLLPEKGGPSAEQKAAIARTAGVDWDKLAEAWEDNAEARGGHRPARHPPRAHRRRVVQGRATRPQRSTSTPARRRTPRLAFGLLLADSGGKLPGGK